MEMKQKCFRISRNNSLIQIYFWRFLDPNRKYFLDHSTQTKKKKYFLDYPARTRHFHDQILLLFSAGRLSHQQKVGHGNETKMFQNQRKQFLDPNIFFLKCAKSRNGVFSKWNFEQG